MSAGFPSPDLSLQVAASALGGGLIVEGAVLGGAVVGADCAASSPSAQPASSTAASAASSTNKRHEPHLCTLRASLDISRRAPTSLLTCDDGGEGPHLLVIALVEGSARIVAGQQRGQAPFDNFVRLLVKYRG
jgi:hypothetical protein